MRTKVRRVATLMAGVAVCAVISPALATPAGAQTACNNSATVSQTSYRYQICGMPDVDQKRVFLPASGGMYCAPTASLNALLWLDRNGYRNVLSGSYDPHDGSSSTYTEITDKVWRLGDRMDTDAEDGTGGDDMRDAIQSLIVEKGYPSYQLKVVKHSMAWQHEPARRLAELGRSSVGVNPIILLWGRYKDGERTGGHFVTLTNATRLEDGMGQISYRDPNNESSIWTQDMARDVTRTLSSAYFSNGYPRIGTSNAYLEAAFVIHRMY